MQRTRFCGSPATATALAMAPGLPPSVLGRLNTAASDRSSSSTSSKPSRPRPSSSPTSPSSCNQKPGHMQHAQAANQHHRGSAHALTMPPCGSWHALLHAFHACSACARDDAPRARHLGQGLPGPPRPQSPRRSCTAWHRTLLAPAKAAHTATSGADAEVDKIPSAPRRFNSHPRSQLHGNCPWGRHRRLHSTHACARSRLKTGC